MAENIVSVLNRKLQQFVIKNSSEWLETAPAILGDHDGNVDAGISGTVYARLRNGQVVTAFNHIAPLIFDLQVLLGRSKTLSNVWQVILVRETYLNPVTAGYIMDHHKQHEFPAGDTVWVNRKQITQLTFLVSDAAAFKIRVYGAVVRTKHGLVLIDNTEGTTAKPDLDVASSIPATGAVYVAIESDEDGVLHTDNVGAAAASPATITLADVPQPEAGRYNVGFVLLYAEQILLTNDMIGIPAPLVTDYDGMDTGFQIDGASADIPLDADEFGFFDVVDEVLKKVTLANIKVTLKNYFDTIYAAISHTHTATKRWEPLANGDPASPELIFWEGDVIMIEVDI